MRKVSVIVPTYKPGKYIWDCLDSLKNQTLEKEEYEVVIVLNGDKEPYFLEISKYVEKNNLKNFKLFFSTKKGVSAARNLGLKNINTKNIIFIDDDDYISSNYLKGLLEMSKSNDEIIVSNIVYFSDLTGKELPTKIKFDENKKYNIKQGKKYFNAVWMKLFPIELLKGLEFHEDLSVGEDSIFMLEMSSNIKTLQSTSKNIIYYRRMRENSVFYKKMSFKQNINILIKNIKYLLPLILKSNYDRIFIFSRMMANIKSFLKRLI